MKNLFQIAWLVLATVALYVFWQTTQHENGRYAFYLVGQDSLWVLDTQTGITAGIAGDAKDKEAVAFVMRPHKSWVAVRGIETLDDRENDDEEKKTILRDLVKALGLRTSGSK